jgi:hypothetical protein
MLSLLPLSPAMGRFIVTLKQGISLGIVSRGMPLSSEKPQLLGVGEKLVHQDLEQRVWRRKVMFLATQNRALLLSKQLMGSVLIQTL